MEIFVVPSLKHIALVKVVATLWNQNDVRALINNYFSVRICKRDDRWIKVGERVIEKVLHLSLPLPLKEKALGFIELIGLQILEWIEFHDEHFHLNLPAELCWTPQGTVDRKRTAEILVKDQNLEISKRYEIACTYCLEEDIFELWRKLTRHTRESYKNADFLIVRIWTRDMEGKVENNARTSYKFKFEYCARFGLKAASEYFFQKLTPTEREECLNCAKTAGNGDVLCFMLSKMDIEQQIEALKDISCRLFTVFLQWPFQRLFIGVVNRMWNFLSKEAYLDLLRCIMCKLMGGSKDWNYENLFREFWQGSPDALKTFIVDENWPLLLELLLSVKNKENIRLILKDTDLVVKEKLIYKDKMNSLCKSAILREEWDFLEFFIQEIFPSKNDILEYKKEFEKSLFFKVQFARNKRKWHQLRIFCDDSLSQNNKRSVEEGECSSSKRYRSLQ